MGRHGPAPEPTKLKLIKGARRSRINEGEPVASDALPLCPPGVSREVRQVWDYTVNELIAMKIASSADRDALHAYCEAVVTHRRACALLAGTDVLLKGLHGGPVRNPAVGIQRDAANAIRTFAQEFGLTPSARSRIVAEQAAAAAMSDDNPFSGTGS